MMSLYAIVPYVTLAIVCIGILGNILSFFLFLKHTSSVNTLLAALSFVDLCLLLFAIPVFILPHTHTHVFGDPFYSIILNYLYPVNLMMQTCSIYIMVLITMERWTAVCRPLQVRIWCTARTTRQALAGIIVFAFLYNIVRFFEYRVTFDPNGARNFSKNWRDFEKHPIYMIGYYTGLYLLTHFLIPFSVFIVMNGHVCKSIITLRRARLMLTRQQQREQSTTMMLLVVTLVFAICNTLPFLLNLAECWKHDLFNDDSTTDIAYQLNDLSNLLVAFNSATTFIVYFAFSEKYRHTAARMLLRWCYTFPKDVKYNSLQSRTPSFRANSLYGPNSSFRDGSCRLKYSTSTELFLRPVSRTERASSEYNDRIKKMSPTKLSATSLALPSSTTMSIGHETNSIKEKRAKFRLARKQRTVSTHTFGSSPKRSCNFIGTTYRQSSQPLPLSSSKNTSIVVEQRRISECLPRETSKSAATAVIVTVRAPSTEPPSKTEPETASTTLDLTEDIETLPISLNNDNTSVNVEPPMSPILDHSNASEAASEDTN